MRCDNHPLFDHLVGVGKQRRRNGEPEHPCRGEIDAETISTYWLDPLSARGPGLKGIAEVLGLTSDLSVSEFHDAHRVRWQAVVCKDKFSDPKGGSTEYALHRKALLVRLRKTRRLNISSTADPLPGLRVLKHCVIMVNLVLRLEIICV
jgi:hypothetical protein